MINNITNCLPYDGKAWVDHDFIQQDVGEDLFHTLLDSIPWQSERYQWFGREIQTTRKVAWCGEPGLKYIYSGQIKIARGWPSSLTQLKAKVELASRESYNTCLLNLYHHGNENMGWHSDDEKELTPNHSIASVSLGAGRDFIFKHKTTQKKVSLHLTHGCLLVMQDETQTHWQHSLPKRLKVKHPRINLTFRHIESNHSTIGQISDIG